jgi:hypothetical protein
VESAAVGVWLACPVSKSWAPRRARGPTTPEFPGTAVSWGESVWEVVEAIPDPAGSVRYRLEPWEARHTIRRIEPYDEASERARETEQRRRRDAVRRRRISLLFAPVLGHLPAHVQRRMESEVGAPARAMTTASALPLMVLGILGTLGFLIFAFGGGDALPGWLVVPLPLALFLFVESSVRLGIAFLQGEPAGSLPGAILYALWRGSCDLLRRRRYASKRLPMRKEIQ